MDDVNLLVIFYSRSGLTEPFGRSFGRGSYPGRGKDSSSALT
jgi:hypothetical protein